MTPRFTLRPVSSLTVQLSALLLGFALQGAASAAEESSGDLPAPAEVARVLKGAPMVRAADSLIQASLTSSVGCSATGPPLASRPAAIARNSA